MSEERERVINALHALISALDSARLAAGQLPDTTPEKLSIQVHLQELNSTLKPYVQSIYDRITQT